MVNTVKIGLFGFGCVGQGLYDIIQQQSLPIEVVGICVKNRNKSRPISLDHFTFDSRNLLEDPRIEVIVELIDNADEAFEIVKKALLLGKKVVTANKKMVAEQLEELLLLQQEGGVLRYEAAVCGSIPIVNTLDSFYGYEPLQKLSGIFNGSSNFILSKIEKEGLDYNQALTLAQDLGFAESDPILDVGGYDTLNKLVILLAHGFGIFTTPSSLFNQGIQKLNDEDLAFARSRSLKIKLTAHATVKGHQVQAYVMPSFVSSSHPLWNIEEEYNAVLVQGQYTDVHLFTGKGAGGHPTAASVVSDIHAIGLNKKYEYHKFYMDQTYVLDNQGLLPVYLRYQRPGQLNEFQFDRIWNEGKSKEGGFVIGTIQLTQLWSLQTFIEDQGIVIIDATCVQQDVFWEKGALQGEMVN